jgi:hypothetical protein
MNFSSSHASHIPLGSANHLGSRSFQGENSVSRTLSYGKNGTRRVAGGHARENGRIHNEQIVCAVDLGVEVDNGFTASAAIIAPNGAGAGPMVRSTRSRIRGDLL